MLISLFELFYKAIWMLALKKSNKDVFLFEISF